MGNARYGMVRHETGPTSPIQQGGQISTHANIRFRRRQHGAGQLDQSKRGVSVLRRRVVP